MMSVFLGRLELYYLIDNKLKVLFGDMGMLSVALIWGATNVVIRGALSGITPFWFCAFRFITAFVAVAIIFGKRAVVLPRNKCLAGMLTGATFICGYLVATWGLLYTTAGNQSFILSMSVVSVPLAVWALTKKFPGWHIMTAILLCIAGIGGLVLDDSMSANLGDILSFAALFFLTAYILLVNKFVRDTDPCGLACWQALGGMIVAIVAASLFEPFPSNITLSAVNAILYAGTIGFALTLVIQTVAQKYTTATRAAIFLSLSGVFGSAIGVVFMGEPMTVRIFVSSALIFMGVLSVEIIPALSYSLSNRNGGRD